MSPSRFPQALATAAARTLATATFAAAAVFSSTASAQTNPSAASAKPQPLLDIRPHHITFSVPNIAKSAAWYSDILGFQVEKTQEFPQFKTRLAFLERGGFRVELIEDANAKPGIVRADVPAHTATHGFTQFMFETPNIAEVKAKLASKNVPIHFEFENTALRFKIFFVRDPDQNLIGFLQRI
jgi:methylmalonyl-CoA/ethylmalonyl-CoA epimerase